MRNINLVVIHCSASDRPKHDSIESIRAWHMARGWSDIGYHYVIQKNGGIYIGRPVARSGAHAKGFNKNSIGVCLTGENEFSDEQFESLKKLCHNLVEQYDLDRCDIIPHCQLNTKKTCPNFLVAEKI